ncbi:hypothetical protein DMN91_009922 [Ooceraea biroi]|uniref:THAP9-like helix-turn-helix domain-containing protein n=2 Tax=Ooceraea biroi TaxID=2015173 RepID=A0A3L8DBH4_OOCBI|nr:hypothetical protein DMN91_009922 [Ooceraea biroi]
MEEKLNSASSVAQSSSKVSEGTAVSPRRIYYSPEKVKLREELRRLKKHYQSQVLKQKVLKQKTRYMQKKIANIKAVFAHLKKKKFLQEEHFDILKDIAAGNDNLLKRIIDKSKGKLLTRKVSPVLRTFALTLHYYSP